MVISTTPCSTPRPDCHPIRDADKLGIGELDPRSLLTVIEQHLDTRRLQFRVEPLGGRERWLIIRPDHGDDDFVRGHRDGPDDPLVVVRGLHHRGHPPLHPDAIRAHDDWVAVTVLVLDIDAEGLRVLGPELEDVTDLDPLPKLQARRHTPGRAPPSAPL